MPVSGIDITGHGHVAHVAMAVKVRARACPEDALVALVGPIGPAVAMRRRERHAARERKRHRARSGKEKAWE